MSRNDSIVPRGFGMPVPISPRRQMDPISMMLSPLGLGEMALVDAMGGFKVDIVENDSDYKVKADFPGIDKGSIDVQLEDDMLTISYVSDEESSERADDGKWLAHERVHSSMKRSFMLPNADEDKTTASVADGVLTVVIPKKEPAQTTKTIEIS